MLQVEAFIVDEANQDYCSVGGVLFTKDMAELVAYPYGKTQIEYTVPDGVKRIGEYAFSKIDNIYKINFPESLESIGGYAFYGIYSIRRIDVPAGVTVTIAENNLVTVKGPKGELAQSIDPSIIVNIEDGKIVG